MALDTACLLLAATRLFPGACRWRSAAGTSLLWRRTLFAVGGTAVLRTLSAAYPVATTKAGNSLFLQLLSSWVKPIYLTFLVHAVALGPLFAHPKTAFTIAILTTISAYASSQTRLVRQWLSQVIGETNLTTPALAPAARGVSWTFAFSGLLILSSCLVILEIHHPYFFTQVMLLRWAPRWHSRCVVICGMAICVPGFLINIWDCLLFQIRNHFFFIPRYTWHISLRAM